MPNTSKHRSGVRDRRTTSRTATSFLEEASALYCLSNLVAGGLDADAAARWEQTPNNNLELPGSPQNAASAIGIGTRE
jgi:hypothetical protein